MRSAGVLIALLLAASCSFNESVSSDDFAALKADVEQVSADVQAITSVTKNMKKGFGWPDDYQEGWRDICTFIIKDAATADPEAQAPRNICGCTLKGLMGAFALKDYESWPQDVKDAAASPYMAMCWNK